MSEKVCNLYREIILSLGLTLDKDDVVIQETAGSDNPVTVKKKTLVIPSDRWLGQSDWENIQAFHPLAENVLRKDSVIFTWLKKVVVLRVSSEIVEMINHILHFVVNKETHAGLNPITQLPALSLAPDGDEKLLSSWKSIVRKIDPIGETPLLTIAMLRGKELHGKEWSRIAKVNFGTFLEALNEPKDNTIYDVKLRKKDIAALRNLFYYLFPELETDETFFSSGSRSGLAPSFHALMNSFSKLMAAINNRRRDWGLELVPMGWVDDLMDLSEFKGLLPNLPGNDGEALPGQTEEPTPTASRGSNARNTEGTRSRREEQQPQRRYFMERGQPETEPVEAVPVSENGRVKFSDLVRAQGRLGRTRRDESDWFEDESAPRGGRNSVVYSTRNGRGSRGFGSQSRQSSRGWSGNGRSGGRRGF